MALAQPPERRERTEQIDEAERRINAALARVHQKARSPAVQDSPSRGLPVGRFMRAQEVFREMAENPLDLESSDSHEEPLDDEQPEPPAG